MPSPHGLSRGNVWASNSSTACPRAAERDRERRAGDAAADDDDAHRGGEAGRAGREEARLAAHARHVVGVGEQHAILGGDARAQHEHVRHGAEHRGDPRRVHERQRQQLHEHRGVVGMPHPAVRPGVHDALARRVHDADVPVLAERLNHPPARPRGGDEQHQRGHGERRHERPAQRHHFDRGAGEDGGVQQRHPLEVRLVHRGGAGGGERAPVARRDRQLREPQQRHRRHHGQVGA